MVRHQAERAIRMNGFRRFSIAAMLGLGLAASVPGRAASGEAGTDRLSAMFAWWDDSMARHIPFEREGFAAFFAPDAVLELNGLPVATGLDAITAHFRAIQESGAQVEIVLPFAAVMVGPRRIYTYHVIRSRRNNEPRCVLASGHADLDAKGLIARLTLVRAPVEPTSSPLAAAACWQK